MDLANIVEDTEQTQFDGQMNEWTDGRTDIRMDGETCGRTERWTDNLKLVYSFNFVGGGYKKYLIFNKPTWHVWCLKVVRNKMSWRHSDIWSHPGHYLVDPYTWLWSPNGQDHIWPWKFKYKGHGQGQTHCYIWGLEFKSICLLFILWQSDHFGWDIANFTFDLENSRSRENLMVTFEA